jgi:AraC-like DNA-binding protein
MDLTLYSAVLLIGLVQGVVVAVLLAVASQNRASNVLLALLLLAFAVSLLPSILGFAGAYDAHPWLSFAPFTVTLGFGPLLYLYVHRLLTDRLPRGGFWHLMPVLIQVAYYAVAFVQPLDWKNSFNASVHGPAVLPLEAILGVVSLVVYWVASFRLFRRYRDWVPSRVSDSENYDLGWMGRFLYLCALGGLLWAGFQAVDEFVKPLGYTMWFWVDLMTAALLYAFAVAGYRRSSLVWPAMPLGELNEPASQAEPANAMPHSGHSGGGSTQPEAKPASGRMTTSNVEAGEGDATWAQTLKGFERALEDQPDWFRSPDLSLDSLARVLATNPWTLSRAINVGSKKNFNDYVNSFRVQAFKDELARAPESGLLELALECGFNSKTSFNRCFKKLEGQSPSQYRRQPAGNA